MVVAGWSLYTAQPLKQTSNRFIKGMKMALEFSRYTCALDFDLQWHTLVCKLKLDMFNTKAISHPDYNIFEIVSSNCTLKLDNFNGFDKDLLDD